MRSLSNEPLSASSHASGGAARAGTASDPSASPKETADARRTRRERADFVSIVIVRKRTVSANHPRPVS